VVLAIGFQLDEHNDFTFSRPRKFSRGVNGGEHGEQLSGEYLARRGKI
jgi:hypothetical protein